MSDHRNLDVWKQSIDFVVVVYDITSKLPKDELYGLTNQIRRSAISIPSNIAEGSARQSDKELIQFLYIALGSLAELETQLLIAQKLSYIKKEDFPSETINAIKKLILGLIKYLKNK